MDTALLAAILNDEGTTHSLSGASAGSSTCASAALQVLLTTNIAAQWAADLGVTKDGSDRVGTWTDQQAAGYTVTQATDGNKPVWTANVQNGLPGLLFTAASQQYLANVASVIAALFDAEDTPYSLYCVGKLASTGAVGTYLSFGQNGTGNFWSHGVTAADLVANNRTGNSISANVNMTTAIGTSTLIHSVSFAGTTVTTRRNGVVNNNAAAMDAGSLGVGTRNAFGALLRNTLSNYLNGYLFEVDIYTAAHDATTAAQVEAFLNAKWAVS